MINFTQIFQAFKNLVGFKNQNEIDVITEQDSGLLIVGNYYEIATYEVNDDFENVANVVSGTINTNGCIFIATDTTPTDWSNESILNDITLTISESGLIVNDLPNITLENIQKSLFLKQDLTNEQTVASYLSEIYNKEVQKLVKNFIETSEKTLLTKKLFNNFNVMISQAKDLTEQKGDFNGFIFQFDNAYNLSCIIESVSLQLNQPDICTIFLYDCSKNVAINSFELEVTEKLTKIQQSLTDFLIKYQDENGSNKIYLLGYYEFNSEITTDLQLSETTKTYKLDYYFAHKQHYISILPIKIASQYHNYNTVTEVYDLPDINGIGLQDYSNGLDCRISFDVDYTDIIIKYKDKFAESLQIQLAKRIIEDCQNSNEFNNITESNRTNWLNTLLMFNNLLNGYEFEDAKGNQGRKKGLIIELVEKFEGVDSVLFPKRSKFVL